MRLDKTTGSLYAPVSYSDTTSSAPNLYIGSDGHVQRSTSSGSSGGGVGFSAHKNGTNQSGIPSGAFTKVTFPTAQFDTSGYWDTSTSQFQPPAGALFTLTIQLYVTGVTAGANLIALIYKNGATYKQALSYPPTSSGAVAVSITEVADGNPYEIYVFLVTSSTGTISGNSQYTFVSALIA